MRLRAIGLGASALVLVCGCGKSNEGNAAAEPAAVAAESVSAAADPSIVTADERAAAIAALGLQAESGGKVMNDCGEAIEPGVHAVDLGGAVGRALLVVMSGGPNTISCYGMTGMQFFLLRNEGGWTQIFADFGHFAPMDTVHEGVRDFAVGGPGFEFPVYEWTGAGYGPGRTIADTEFPQSVN